MTIFLTYGQPSATHIHTTGKLRTEPSKSPALCGAKALKGDNYRFAGRSDMVVFSATVNPCGACWVKAAERKTA